MSIFFFLVFSSLEVDLDLDFLTTALHDLRLDEVPEMPLAGCEVEDPGESYRVFTKNCT